MIRNIIVFFLNRLVCGRLSLSREVSLLYKQEINGNKTNIDSAIQVLNTHKTVSFKFDGEQM